MTNIDKLKVSRILSNVLRDLGGQEFVTEWARNNPTDFMKLYVSAGQVETSLVMPNGVDDDLTLKPIEVGPLSSEMAPLGAGAFDRGKAAEYLSISIRLLDDLLSAGTITRIKIGRKTLIRRVDLDRYLSRLAGEATS